MNILLILEIFTLIILVGYLVILISIFSMNAYTRITNQSSVSVPFVPIPDVALSILGQHVSIDDDSLVYDLGSGDGKIVHYLYQRNKKGNYVGVERNPFPYLLSIWKSWSIPRTQVKFLLKNMDDVDLSRATHVTMYLFPKFVDELFPKLVRELKPGTRVYSIDYPFSEKAPAQVIAINPNQKALGRNLYIYEF